MKLKLMLDNKSPSSYLVNLKDLFYCTKSELLWIDKVSISALLLIQD